MDILRQEKAQCDQRTKKIRCLNTEIEEFGTDGNVILVKRADYAENVRLFLMATSQLQKGF